MVVKVLANNANKSASPEPWIMLGDMFSRFSLMGK